MNSSFEPLGRGRAEFIPSETRRSVLGDVPPIDAAATEAVDIAFGAMAADAAASVPDPLAELRAVIEQREAEAFARGRAEAADTLAPALATLEQLREGLSTLRRDYLAAQRETLVELATAMAGAVLERELQAPETLAAQLEGAIAALEPEEPIEIALSSDDAERMGGVLEDWPALMGGGSVGIREDLAAGEYLVRSGVREMDGRREALLAELRASLLEVAGSGVAEAGE